VAPEDEQGDFENDLDPDAPDESDMDSSEEPDLLPCPHCRRMIDEDTERCPHCGDYVDAGDNPSRRTPWALLIIGAIVLLLILALSFARGATA
jgi:uncharacterized paraquat-inducible protein A